MYLFIYLSTLKDNDCMFNNTVFFMDSSVKLTKKFGWDTISEICFYFEHIFFNKTLDFITHTEHINPSF